MYIDHQKIVNLCARLDKDELAKRFEHALAALWFTYLNARNYDNPAESINLEKLTLAALEDAMEEPQHGT